MRLTVSLSQGLESLRSLTFSSFCQTMYLIAARLRGLFSVTTLSERSLNQRKASLGST